MSKKHEIDMTQGPLLKNIISFAVPLMLTGLLQLTYNAADVIVIGRFAGSDSLAAVGSTSSLYNLVVNLFLGLAAGTSVIISILYGSKDNKGLFRAVHTAVTVSIIFGIFVAVLGISICKPMLRIMGTPPEVLPKATLYLQIIFSGMPAAMFYNFGSAILRSVGDTKRPLYFLSVSGAINVVVNLILVIFFKMDVAGVAIATVLSNYVAAFLIFLSLSTSDGAYKLQPKKIRIYKKEFFNLVRVGLPAGIQSSLFSISNVLIQSSINLFGATAMAGSSVSGNVEGFAYTVMNSLMQTAITACGQNLGAKDIKRIKRSMALCLLVVSAVGIFMSLVILSLKNILLGLYTTDAAVLQVATTRLYWMIIPYVFVGLMEVTAGVMRGLRYSILPMIVSLLGSCALRIVWIGTVFQWHKTLPILFLSYPVSWAVTALAHFICIFFALKKLKKEFANEGVLQ